MLKKIAVDSQDGVEFTDITSQVEEALQDSEVEAGIMNIFVPHASAAVTIMGTNGADIAKDIKFEINKLDDNFGHIEGRTSSAHFKSSLLGVDLTLNIDEGELKLGENQGIYFSEFSGPAEREVLIKILEG